MSSFAGDPAFHERLVQNGPVSLHFERLDPLLDWLRARGYRIDRFDCTHWVHERTAHEILADALGFSDYYGLNLDAFNDCLSELAIDDAGRALVFDHYDVIAKQLPHVAWHFLDIIAINARTHLRFGRRLLALVHSDDRDLTFAPVGGSPVVVA